MLTPDDLGDVLRRRAEGQTWQAIATAYGITREGARYSHRRALRLLGEAEAAQRAMAGQEEPEHSQAWLRSRDRRRKEDARKVVQND